MPKEIIESINKGGNMQIMFLDESGDHNLDPKKVDASYPIFVLTGCIFDEHYYNQEVISKFNKFKKSFFGSDDIILHTLEMTRPLKSKEKRFLKLVDKGFRVKFYTQLSTILEEINFTLVACAIRKQEHFIKYGLSALDPYLLSFDNLLNRFIFELRSPNKGKIVAERRNSILDNQLELAWLNTKINGTELVKGAEVKEKIENLYMTPKSKNEPGLQIADLVANPIGRNVLGMKRKVGNEIDFEVLKKKFRNRNGRIVNYGLTIIPKK